ncbi:MAG: 4Fe-4S single cluster domain-containing protein [Campylobacterota bacterium]|nr:4Fe-4S single cluster domain-containing protein [Campylobacterota bacterium]
MKIYHFDIVKDILGFGNRLVIWSSGCPFSCDGCIVEELQSSKLGTDYKIEQFYNLIINYLDKIDGITFSGGEPLYQSKELLDFLLLLPKELDKMLFTGYDYNELNQNQINCYNMFDLVIEGKFDNKKTGNFLWRGSSNQEIKSPTNKYQPILKDLYNSKSAGLEININNKEIIYYGIPTKNNEIKKIANLLN